MFTTITRNDAFYNALVSEIDRAVALAAGTRWQNATEDAANYLLQAETIEYDYRECLLRVPSATTEGQEYHTGRHTCQCRAIELGRPCWHRSAATIMLNTIARLEREAEEQRKVAQQVQPQQRMTVEERRKAFADMAELF